MRNLNEVQKTWLGIISVFLFIVFIYNNTSFSYPVYAQTSITQQTALANEQHLDNDKDKNKSRQNTNNNVNEQANALTVANYLDKAFCSSKAGTTTYPYKSIVLVDLNRFYQDMLSGEVDEQTGLKEFLYEFFYTDKYKLWPFNGLAVNGKFYNSSCNKWDFTLNPYVGINGKYGVYVLGLFGDSSANFGVIKELVNKYKFDSVYTAELGRVELDNKIVLLAKDLTKCVDSCIGINVQALGLSKNAILSRPVSLAIERIEYPNKLKSLEKGQVKLTVKNNADASLLDASFYTVYIKELSSRNIPDLYVKTWDSLHIPAYVNSKPILPGETTVVSFDVGPYIYPTKYSGKFALLFNSKKLNNTGFEVSLNVLKGKSRLGYIKGRDLDYVNVHNKPDLRAPVVFKLDVGEWVVVNKVNGAWVNITAQYGDSGWVYRPMIKLE